MTKMVYDKKTRFDRNGHRYLVKDGQEEKEIERQSQAAEGKRTYRPLEWVEREVRKFEDKPAFQHSSDTPSRLKELLGKDSEFVQNLRMKIRDRFSRNEVAKRVRAAKTREEKKAILEEFHKVAEIARKRTALKLKCMEEIRRYRQKCQR